MTKKLHTLSTLFLILFISSLSANANDYKNYKISIRPFNFDPSYDTYIEEIIESVLIDNGLSVFNRDKNTDKMMLEEQENIKNNNQEVELQAKNKSIITHVVSGNIMKLEDKYICSISIKNINTYEPEKSVTKVMDNLSYDNISALALDLYKKITGGEANIKRESLNNNINLKQNNNRQGISRYPAMFTGLLFFASGLAGTIYSGMELTSWYSKVGGAAANEYYLYKNPNGLINYGIEYTRKDLYDAWKKGNINTKPDDMPALNPLANSIILGSSIAMTIIGISLFGWSLSDQPYFLSHIDIIPTIFDGNGRLNMGVQMAFTFNYR